MEKKAKRCEYCGAKFEPYKSDQRYCSQWCSRNAQRRLMRDREREKRARLKAEQVLPPAKPRPQKEKTLCLNYRKPKSPSSTKYDGKTLGQWVQEAMNCNLDYGTYRGLIKAGKTYEELLGQAPFRKVPVHQHTPHRER